MYTNTSTIATHEKYRYCILLNRYFLHCRYLTPSFLISSPSYFLPLFPSLSLPLYYFHLSISFHLSPFHRIRSRVFDSNYLRVKFLTFSFSTIKKTPSFLCSRNYFFIYLIRGSLFPHPSEIFTSACLCISVLFTLFIIMILWDKVRKGREFFSCFTSHPPCPLLAFSLHHSLPPLLGIFTIFVFYVRSFFS